MTELITEYKQAIAESFSRSASRYDAVAKVQQQAGHHLLSAMKNSINGIESISTVADIGCGTGYLYPFLNEWLQPEDYFGVDIAQGMLDIAAERYQQANNTQWLCSDAEYLQLQDNAVDMVFSNFALQWIDDLPQLLTSIWRVLKPGGYFCLTSLDANTLHELRTSWEKVDRFHHVNDFKATACWQTALENHCFSLMHHKQYNLVDYYDTVYNLLRSIRDIGANVVQQGAFQGLMGKQHFADFISAYEQYREPQGLPATYAVDEWILRKP